MNDIYFPGMQETDKAKLTQFITINNEKTGKPDKIQLSVLLNALGIVTTSTLPPTGNVSVTYMEALTLISDSTLEVGSHYTLTDQADGGITLLAVSSNQFSLEGQGVFLNPDFQGEGDYSGVTGFDINQGVWIASNEGTYSVGQVVIWGGLHYLIVDDAEFDTTPPDTNGNAYQLLSKSSANVGYIEEVDFILFDFNNDSIVYRTDKRRNFVVDNNKFQWGNNNVVDNSILSGSGCDIINQRGYIVQNTISNAGYLTCNENFSGVIVGSKIELATWAITGTSEIINCILANNHNGTYTISSKDYSQKTITDLGSTFEADLDMTDGIDYVNATFILTVPTALNYVGIFTLKNNTGKTIKKIANLPQTHKSRFLVQAGNTQIFEHTSIVSVGAENLISDAASTNIINGTNADFIEYEYVADANGVKVGRRYNAVIAA